MKTIFFGLAQQYDSGSIPSVALNAGGSVLEIHKNQAGITLYYRVGKLKEATVEWGKDQPPLDGGNEPSCALNVSNVAVEMHKNEAGHTLYTRVGKLSVANLSVEWKKSHDSDGGYTPSVALNDQNITVEVHRTNNVLHTDRLYYRVGSAGTEKVDWKGSHEYDKGYFPKVALNNGKVVVEVHQSGSTVDSSSKLTYRVGRIDGDKIKFDKESSQFGDGVSPAVALTDDGYVFVTWTKNFKLMQRVGQVSGSNISWLTTAEEYDDGKESSVATAGGMAIQVHQSETIKFGLWYSTSILTDRAKWMQERLGALGNKPMSSLVLPASHDAGMYERGIAILGKTQQLSIYGQLAYGIRWFDLRPEWTGSKFIIHHGVIGGPDLSTVLADIKKFAQEGHRELVLLKFSHFKNIDNNTYVKLRDQVAAALNPWLVKSKSANKRLAEMSLAEYVPTGMAALVVVDENYAIDKPAPGFWIFRDAAWGKDDHPAGYDPAVGDLRVYDVYSNTMFVETMIANQREKFANYNGYCPAKPSVPCDLYLLSWTLTPPTDVWDTSKAANRCLGEQMTKIPDPNGFGKIINMLYVDYVEYARVTDVGLFQNGVPFPRP